MIRILHTADWQLGLRLNFVPGEAGARLRAERFATVERIADLAHAEQVDAVLVAGDVFDDNGVGPDTIQQAREVLAKFDVPVVLLPGNHDPATADSALARIADTTPNVHVTLTSAPLRFGALEIHPCPLVSRHQYDDPTANLPDRGAADTVRVALAHGGVLEFGEATESPNCIDAAAVIARGFDYLALGDWHGVFRFSDRAWYSGAHEATRFKEKSPGRVLVVEIEGPGADPRVTVHTVARTHWAQARFEFSGDADLVGFETWFAAFETPSRTLAEVEFDGVLSLAGRSRLDALLEEYGGRLALLRVERDAIVAEPTAEDLQALRGEGFVAHALDVLRAGEHEHDAAALRLMHRLVLAEDR
ncbi:MAG: DNA repair exonuclease [Chromatiales bacterium]|nr:DNA repair exonuclease [Chromatiales bacterium]